MVTRRDLELPDGRVLVVHDAGDSDPSAQFTLIGALAAPAWRPHLGPRRVSRGDGLAARPGSM